MVEWRIIGVLGSGLTRIAPGLHPSITPSAVGVIRQFHHMNTALLIAHRILCGTHASSKGEFQDYPELQGRQVGFSSVSVFLCNAIAESRAFLRRFFGLWFEQKIAKDEKLAPTGRVIPMLEPDQQASASRDGVFIRKKRAGRGERLSRHATFPSHCARNSMPRACWLQARIPKTSAIGPSGDTARFPGGQINRAWYK